LAASIVLAYMNIIRIVVAGLAGGLAGNGVLGALFSTPWIRAVLYDPSTQSPLFLEITATRDIPLSVAGLVLLSIIHAALFARLAPAIPGLSWRAKGVFWGFVIWLMYWVFQEWFIYHTLLREPIALCLFELALLLAGSLVEGLVIARLARAGTSP
jgi:hypothetical protein